MDFLVHADNRTKSLLVFAGFALIGVVGIIDFLTGYELAFSLFYVLPISLITWLTSRWFGFAASLVIAVVWLGADLASGHFYSHPLIPIWNTLIRLAFFVIITFQLSALRKAIQREGDLARTDYLTRAVNSRFLYELARMEMDRLRRYQRPFTIAYLDLDNFKIVNEQSGHTVGDEVLRTVVSVLKTTLRITDVVARLGGDEFALLLPETGEESARVVFPKLQGRLLEEMRRKHWPVTFSIGVLTCRAVPPTVDDMVRLADNLMYTVKQESKNGIRYSTYAG